MFNRNGADEVYAEHNKFNEASIIFVMIIMIMVITILLLLVFAKIIKMNCNNNNSQNINCIVSDDNGNQK